MSEPESDRNSFSQDESSQLMSIESHEIQRRDFEGELQRTRRSTRQVLFQESLRQDSQESHSDDLIDDDIVRDQTFQLAEGGKKGGKEDVSSPDSDVSTTSDLS